MANSTKRRDFLKLIGTGAIAGAIEPNIAKALAIPANNRKGTIEDVEHIVILMQENRPFDHQFGTLRGVRGFADPRAVKIHLPLKTGNGTTLASVFLQPAGATNIANGFAVPPDYGDLGGPSDGVEVVPPFRVNPESIQPGLKSLGLTYFPGTDHGWETTHLAWNWGQYDMWPIQKGPIAMSYMTRIDIPYHYALADAFTVGDAYYCSIMGPTNPNRDYLWSGCIGNVNYLGPGGADGHGAGPATYNGLSVNNAYWVWKTFPERLEAAGITWKVYQDLAGATFAPDFGDGTGNSFAGNYTDNSLLYFNQYATASPGTPLFDRGCKGTEIINKIPTSGASDSEWKAWQELLFDEFKYDVEHGTLPQVSWIVGPAGYTEHPDYPIDYGAWYVSRVLDILVSNPEVFSKTVFIIDYDEADGSFDHLVPPTPPQTPAYGKSTVSIENEIVITSQPNGPIGLGTRVALLAVSPWSKGGYVCSEVFDHTSVIRFVEKRFGVTEPNISPWRRAVVGDLTAMFNFANPNSERVDLPSTAGFVPPKDQLAGGDVTTFVPTLDGVFLGVPKQEKGLRPARALPYELNVHAVVNASKHEVVLTFINTGRATVVFQVRAANAADTVRTYTVEPGKQLSDSWTIDWIYHLSVYGPNGFERVFEGSIRPGAALLDVVSGYKVNVDTERHGSIDWRITNLGSTGAEVNVLDAYTGESTVEQVKPNGKFIDTLSLDQFHGWYDLIITVTGDSVFRYRLAGHVETGAPSFSDPVLGGLVTLKL